MRYFVEITAAAEGYEALIYQDNPAVGRIRPGLALGPQASLHIKDKPYTLGELVAALAGANRRLLAEAFDQRGQIELGQHLYRELFGETLPGALKRHESGPLDLRIVTADEHLMRLPWPLLAHQGVFLATEGWAVSLARSRELQRCALPEHPRLLVIAPEPAGARTRAKAHIEQLERRLSIYDHRLRLDEHLRLVTSWEELLECLSEFSPHLVYFYGHGSGDAYSSQMVFADGAQRRIEKPVTDLVQELRALPELPLLVYVNCCGGDAGGLLGAGMQLSPYVPAVITNRTIAEVDWAQSTALALWEGVLVKGLAPHAALARLPAGLAELNLSFGDARWITPVLHGHYDRWEAPPARRYDAQERDPFWHLKLDRVGQFGAVSYQTRQMLRERRPSSLAYVWYGQPGQGIELFHRRLQVELQDDLHPHATLYEVRPEWPRQFLDPERSFEEMLTEAFGVASLKLVSQSIRAVSRGAAGRPVLVYVRHQPVRSKDVLSLPQLKAYIRWWDRAFAPLLREHQYALLGISFEVEKPARFRSFLLDGEQIATVDLTHTNFRLLDELERIAKDDLYDFLKAHNIQLPSRQRDRILDEILDQTSGNYEQTITSLRRYVDRALDQIEDEKRRQPAAEADYDY